MLKQDKKVVVLSDGACYSEFIVSSLRINNNYILSNQDLNNHCFWIESLKNVNFTNEFEYLDSVTTRIR